ncbi:MAG: hypothetical protein ACP5JG_14810 [Anaerolineae bacterium]
MRPDVPSGSRDEPSLPERTSTAILPPASDTPGIAKEVAATSTPLPQPSATSTPVPSPTSAPTNSPPPSPSLTSTPMDTDTPQPSAAATLTPSPTDTPSPSPTATDTPTPTSTPRPSPTSTGRPRTTAAPTATPEPDSGVISGRVLLEGEPPSQAVTLVLENQAYRVVREIEVSDGEYRFENLSASTEGYNVVFTQDRNPQFEVDNVVSWAWIGPTPVGDGDTVRLADLDIGLLGLHQVNPPLDASLDAGTITPESPLVFEWTPYPLASRYWLDLRSGSALQLIWQSDFVESPSVAFEGELTDGKAIDPGTYWWRVSAQVDGIAMTVSGPLAGFTIRP